jgi:hypothetical protein
MPEIWRIRIFTPAGSAAVRLSLTFEIPLSSARATPPCPGSRAFFCGSRREPRLDLAVVGRRVDNLVVQLEGLFKWLGAMVLGLFAAFATYALLGFIGGGQAQAPIAVLIFAVTVLAFGWAWN